MFKECCGVTFSEFYVVLILLVSERNTGDWLKLRDLDKKRGSTTSVGTANLRLGAPWCTCKFSTHTDNYCLYWNWIWKWMAFSAAVVSCDKLCIKSRLNHIVLSFIVVLDSGDCWGSCGVPRNDDSLSQMGNFWTVLFYQSLILFPSRHDHFSCNLFV